MTTVAMAALYKAVGDRLTAAGLNAYAGIVPPGTAYPYITYFWSGGGARNAVRKNDAEIVMTIKALSDSLAEAFVQAEAIETALDDHGVFDNATDFLYGGSAWKILTVTQEEVIQYTEMFANVAPIYHAGARYRFVMETV